MPKNTKVTGLSLLKGVPLIVTLLATAATAQRPAAAPIKLQQLAPNVYWAKQFSNVGVVIGTDGVIVYDATASIDGAHQLLAEIAKVTDKPVKTVILSHVDGDHVDGLAGFPAGVRVIAQTETQKMLRDDTAAGKKNSVPADKLPTEAIATTKTMVLNGVKIELLHVAPAHTSGDLVAYLPDQKIVFAGDIFCMDQPRPYIKPETGGSSAGWIKTARAILALHPKQVLVGHGGVETPATLKPFIDTAAAERSKIIALAAKGEPLPKIEKDVGEPQPSTPPPPPNSHLAQFGQVVFNEVKAGR